MEPASLFAYNEFWIEDSEPLLELKQQNSGY